jgi:glutamate--cysteine ligase
MQSRARGVLELSQAGLLARGLGEERWLAPVTENVARGKVQADDLLAAYQGDWGGDLTKVYAATSLL